HTVGGLGALAEPFGDAFDLQHDAIRVVLLEQRIVGADLLDEAAVAGRVAVGHDDRVVGALLGAATGETDLQHGLSPLGFSYFLNGLKPGGRPPSPGSLGPEPPRPGS